MPGYSLVPELQAELPAAPSGANEMQMKRRREGFWECRPSCQDPEMAFSANPQPQVGILEREDQELPRP